MAILVSPGVDVSIIDESFYGGGGPGTVPLIVIATGLNKPSPTGTGLAPGTLASQANKLYLMTSQRELIQTFGNPKFYSIMGTQIHGHELNEYGLHAAYQYLGLSNRAYVIRAAIDTNQLLPSVDPPRGAPVAGTYWFDIAESEFGIFQSNGNPVPGNAWTVQPVNIVNDTRLVDNNSVPLGSFGADGDFAVVTLERHNRIYEKIANTWFRVGSDEWKAERPTTVSGTPTPDFAGGTITINGAGNPVTLPSDIDGMVQAINDAGITGISASNNGGSLVISNAVGGDITLADQDGGTALAGLGLTSGATVKGVTLNYAPHTQVPAGSVQGDVWIKTTTPNRGAKYLVKLYNSALSQFVQMAAPFYPDDTAANAGGALGPNPAVGTIYVRYNTDGASDRPLASSELYRWNGSGWLPLVYEAGVDSPTSEPAEDALWYSTDFQADVMYGNGENWLGYRRRYPDTDPNGVIIGGVVPQAQSDGTALADFDLWIDTSDLENYPMIYRYNATTQRWAQIDKTDQTTPFGMIFADARADSGVTFTGIPNAGAYAYDSTATSDMTQSDFVDPDAPDPRTYPDGMLLFNTRYSTYNVKQWKPNYFFEGGFDGATDFTSVGYYKGEHSTYRFPALRSAGRWVTASGNKADGSPFMGRKAQRTMIVRSLGATISDNDNIRSEIVYFNLLAAPGYPEMIDEMVSLNVDQKQFSFIVADPPIRLAANATAIQQWANNANNAASNGEDGLVSRDDFIAVYYPWALSTNIDGTEVMVPPSTVALRTIAYNDQIAYPWMAPAGFSRGLVTNATSVGYLSSEGEFTPVILNQGQRDTLYQYSINPIAYIAGRGLVLYGEKTLASETTALDRIAVARLANYLRYNLDLIVKPYLFENNTQHTRDSAKNTVERFLQGVVGLQGLEDFAVVCDGSNNTPPRIDQNQLWIDVLIRPPKAIEFIYIPVRVRNSADPLS